MDDLPSPLRTSSLRLPANSREFWALALALMAVFLLVQVGAPIIRDLEFLDPKIRDYFIGISFAAFPLIHRSCKQNLARFSTTDEPVLHDSAPWYVAGVVAAAVIFGWNQFVSFLALVAINMVLSPFDGAAMQSVDTNVLNTAATSAALVVVLPLSAVAALYAGILLNRHTRSHTFASVALASACFITINALMTWALQPDLIDAIVAQITAGGENAVGVLIGMSGVGIAIFGFGSLGVFVSRYNRERPVGRIVEAARKLPPDEREALALQLAARINRTARPVVQPPLPTGAPCGAGTWRGKCGAGECRHGRALGAGLHAALFGDQCISGVSSAKRWPADRAGVVGPGAQSFVAAG
jgi:hypothetical protein